MILDNTFKSYNDLGCHIYTKDGKTYTRFTLYAPNVGDVELIVRDYTRVKMEKNFEGVHEVHLEGDLTWKSYYYELNFGDFKVTKTDPYGFFTGYRPDHDSIVYDTLNDNYKWNDKKYMDARKPEWHSYSKPIHIYEMHLGSWIKRYGDFHNYRTIADELVHYLKEHSYTHVELMPIMEHPLDDSWGYQLTGFFSPTSRFGNPADFKYFVDKLHQAGIGVVLDIVIGHINKDLYSLFKFDGSYMLEFEDEFRRENHEWGTANIDFGKPFSKMFFSSVIDFWISVYHIDGFRVDAVSKLFYNLGNKDFGYNEEGIRFLQHITSYCKVQHSHVLFFAEDSTAFDKVTAEPKHGGIGFNYKWDMGFMNDTLKFYSENDEFRKWHPGNITFSHYYFYSEKFILPFSHDEVVYGKKSLLNKMNSSYDLNFKKLSNLMVYFFGFPGKKLIFMGQEFAQFDEWNFKKELDWNLLSFDSHRRFNQFYKDIARFYLNNQSLWKNDFDPNMYKWAVIDEYNAVFAFKRYIKTNHVIVVLNTIEKDTHMLIGVDQDIEYEVAIDNYNKSYFGWDDKYSLHAQKGDRVAGYQYFIEFHLKPYQAFILKPKKVK